MRENVATPLWGKCEVATHTLENGTWESFEILKNSERHCKGQNTLHWSVFNTVEKVLKFRCPKWPRMNHLDICSTSYGRKKSRGIKLAIWLPTTKSQESTRFWCVQVERNTPLESSRRKLQLWFRPHPNPSLGREVMNAQSPKSPNWDDFGTPLWESREKEPFGCKCGGELQRILYGGRWWLPPNSGHGESSESKVARGLSQRWKCAEWVLTNLLVGFGCRTNNEVSLSLFLV
jgi:hypothetical protein